MFFRQSFNVYCAKSHQDCGGKIMVWTTITGNIKYKVITLTIIMLENKSIIVIKTTPNLYIFPNRAWNNFIIIIAKIYNWSNYIINNIKSVCIWKTYYAAWPTNGDKCVL